PWRRRASRSRTPSDSSFQPGREELLDLAAAARRDEACRHALALEHADRRHGLDAEALEQLRTFLLRDGVEQERRVVAPTLKHLGEESLHAAAAAGRVRMEEAQTWLRGRRGGADRLAD